MATYNAFGAVYTTVLSLYPDTSITDFTDAATITAALNRIARDVAMAMPAELLGQISVVDCEMPVRYATAGQTTFTLGLFPINSATLHLWKFPPLAAFEGTFNFGLNPYSDIYFRKPVLGYNEIASGNYSVNATTGVVTLSGDLGSGLTVGERIYASYNVSVANSSYSLPSVADIVAYGAAAELGEQLYSESMQVWALVASYRKKYDGYIELIRAGKWVPSELRLLFWWTDIEPSGSAGSVRVYRT